MVRKCCSGEQYRGPCQRWGSQPALLHSPWRPGALAALAPRPLTKAVGALTWRPSSRHSHQLGTSVMP